MSEEPAKEVKGKKSKLPLIIMALVLLLGGGGGGAYFFLGGSGEKKGDTEEEAHHEEAHEESHLESFPLEAFVVNLANSGSFLKVVLHAEFDPKALPHAKGEEGGGGGGHGGGGGAEPPAPIKPKLPMIRDAIINVLSAKTGEEALSVSSRENIKEELVDAMNAAVGTDEPLFVAIYFDEFIVQ